ncbi:MAG: DUF4375 domain-containing protein [Bacteroidota bacterium]
MAKADNTDNSQKLSADQLNALSEYSSREFLQEIYKPIKGIVKKKSGENPVSQLSNGQRALYYFNLLDTIVSKEGFGIFYWEYYWEDVELTVKNIKESLLYFKCMELFEIVAQSEKIFKEYEHLYESNKWIDNSVAIDKNTPKFDDLDDKYMKHAIDGYNRIKDVVLFNENEFCE